MARPDIGFAVEHDVRRVLDVQGGQDRLARVAALTSRELAANGIGVDLDRGEVHLGGVISLPTFNRGIADPQYLFVKDRKSVVEGKRVSVRVDLGGVGII